MKHLENITSPPGGSIQVRLLFPFLEAADQVFGITKTSVKQGLLVFDLTCVQFDLLYLQYCNHPPGAAKLLSPKFNGL